MGTRFDGIDEFVAVTRLGSFTAVAVEMGMAKSAIARSVSRLENRLGCKLLHRTTRRLTLTPDGEAWLEHCIAALGELERGEAALMVARNMPSGRVRIDLPTAFGRWHMMPALLEIARQYPALSLKASFTDRRVDLISENIDLTIRIGVLDNSADVAARQIGVQQMVIVAAPEYLAKRGVPKALADLASHDCISGRQTESRGAWLIRQPDGLVARHSVPVRHELQDYETVLMAVTAGHGLAQLPSWIVENDVRLGRLRVVLNDHAGSKLPINVIWPTTRAPPAKVRVLIDGLVKWARGASDMKLSEKSNSDWTSEALALRSTA